MAESTTVDDLQCAKDHALWREEIGAWRNDHARALKTLERATSFILEHEAELERHSREIAEHEALKDDAPDRVQTRKERHLAVALRHNSLRGRHRGLIEEIMRLQVMLHKAAHGNIL